MKYSVRKPDTWKFLPLYEKLQYYKKQLNESYAPFADKIQAKEIIKEQLGDYIQTARIVRILDSVDDFSENDIHENHILKASHGCGWNIDLKQETNIDTIKQKLKSWNKPYNSDDEPHYKYISPRFFIEEKIPDRKYGITGNAITYCIRCIHGEPFVIGVRDGPFQNNYDLDWNPVKKMEMPDIRRPRILDKMLYVAQILSKPFEFVRIDLYIGENDIIYFSEYTFTPSAGFMFYSPQYEKYYGSFWT